MKKGEKMRAAILSAGLRLYATDPASVTAHRIGREVGRTHAGVLYHYGSTEALREAVAREAVRVGDSRVILHLIACGSPLVAGMSETDRAAHLRAAR